jgi:hypothetical protein
MTTPNIKQVYLNKMAPPNIKQVYVEPRESKPEFRRIDDITGQPKKLSSLGSVAKYPCVKSAVEKFKAFKKRPKYYIYNLMPVILLIFLILFITLVTYRGTNAIKMEKSSNLLDEATKEVDYLTAILKDLKNNSGSVDDITKAEANLDEVNKKLYIISGEKNQCIYIDNICDKTVDLCNGLLASILMIYIGSASIRLYQLRKNLDKERQICIE